MILVGTDPYHVIGHMSGHIPTSFEFPSLWNMNSVERILIEISINGWVKKNLQTLIKNGREKIDSSKIKNLPI